MRHLFTSAALSTLAITALFASQALADTYYVRTGGNDANSGTTPAQAFATPEMASEMLEAGDIVYIGGGEYTSQIITANSGTDDDRIQYIADTNGSQTGDAGEVVIRFANAPVVLISEKSFTSFVGFTFRGRSGSKVSVVQIDSNASQITFDNCLVEDSIKHGIWIKNASDILITGSTVQGSGEDGINIERGTSISLIDSTVTTSKKKGVKIKKAGSSILVDRCILTQNGNHGLSMEEGVTAVVLNTLSTKNKDGFHTHKDCDIKIWNCTSAANKDYGIKAHDGAMIEVVNTISYKNGRDGIRFDAKKGKTLAATHHHNISFGNKFKDWKGFTPSKTDLSIDPEFASTNSYYLALSSPARNTGTDGSLFTEVDLTGKPRPEGGAWDIGCYEGFGGPTVQYVRTRGNDSNSGLTPGQAFRTIQRAIKECVSPGCKIYVGPGVYTETLEIGTGAGTSAQDGAELSPNMIIADVGGVHTKDDPGEVLIDGQGSKTHGIKISSRDHWVIDGFSIRNQREYSVYGVSSGLSILNSTLEVPKGYSIYISAMGDVTVSDCEFERNQTSGHTMWITPMNRATPTSVTITRNDATLKDNLYLSTKFNQGKLGNDGSYGSERGSYTYGAIVYGWGRPMVERIEISNNQFSDCYLGIYSGVYSRYPTTSVIANNTVSGSMYGIYSYGYNAKSTHLVNNIIDNSYFGLLSYSYRGSPAVVTGLLENNITYDMVRYRRSFEFDIIQASPMFADPKSGDFSLQAGSPGIDAGTVNNAPSTDIKGRSRPTDGNNDGVAQIDLGAYELVTTPTKLRVVQWREISGHRDMSSD